VSAQRVNNNTHVMKMHRGLKRDMSKKLVVNRPITQHANGSKCETGSTST